MTVAAIALLVLTPSIGIAQKSKTKSTPPPKQQPKKQPQNETKGQGQLVGGYVKFGETYSLSDGLNFQIIRAKYSMEPFACYSREYGHADQKLIILDISIKNAANYDNDHFPPISFLDAAGTKYDGVMVGLVSNGIKEYYRVLKPGQGLGQPGLNDPLRIACLVPLESKITKIIVNEPRLNKNEEVFRYLMAGTDKEADPANVIAPLPANIADASDPSGAKGMAAGKAKIGDTFTSYIFSYRVNGIKTTSDPLYEGAAPDEGKKFAIISITYKNIGFEKLSTFYSVDTEGNQLKDTDGERGTFWGILKGNTDAQVGDSYEMEPGDERTIRLVFQIDQKATPKSLKFAATNYTYPWMIDLTQ